MAEGYARLERRVYRARYRGFESPLAPPFLPNFRTRPIRGLYGAFIKLGIGQGLNEPSFDWPDSTVLLTRNGIILLVTKPRAIVSPPL